MTGFKVQQISGVGIAKMLYKNVAQPPVALSLFFFLLNLF